MSVKVGNSMQELLRHRGGRGVGEVLLLIFLGVQDKYLVNACYWAYSKINMTGLAEDEQWKN
jgi:hypothetical protein